MSRYIRSGFSYFISSLVIGTIIYIIISGMLYVFKKRSKIPISKLLAELTFVIYTITVLKITGIIGMTFHVSYFLHSFSFKIPFVGSSIKMVLLNLLLFVPIGFLFPIAIKSEKWNYKRITIAGFCFTFVIEFLQMFAGRMSEIDDIIINIVGTIIGYAINKALTKLWYYRQP